MAIHGLARSHRFSAPTVVPRPMGSLLDRASEFRHKYERLRVTHKGKLDKAKDLGRVAVRTGEVALGAAIFGYLQGRSGAVKIGPFPVDLAAGIVGHVIGFTGVAEEFSPHIHAVADGAVASYANTWARGMGREARAKKGLPPMVSGSMGAMPLPEATGGSALTNEELNKL